MRHSRVFVGALIVGLILGTVAATAFAIEDRHAVPTYSVNPAGQTYGSAAHAMLPDEYPVLMDEIHLYSADGKTVIGTFRVVDAARETPK